MARPLPSLTIQNLSISSLPASSFFLIMAIFSIISLVAFLCASHRTGKPHKLKEETKARLKSTISSKALLMVKMISLRKVEVEGEEEEDDDDEAVWKKTIMMGERCRPLDFSGKIVYDSEGNLLPSSPHEKQNS